MNIIDKKFYNKNILRVLLSFVLATFGMIAYIYSTRFSIEFPIGKSDTIGFMPGDLLFLIVLTVLYSKFIKRSYKFSTAFAIIALIVAATSLMLTDIYKYMKIFYMLKTVPALYIISLIGYAFMYYCAIAFLDDFIIKNINKNTVAKEYKALNLTLMLMLISLPVYLLIFPGAIRFEAGATISMISGELASKYIAPPFWQYFVSIFYHIGKWLNSDTLGLIIYFAFVGFVSFYALALIIIRAAKLNINRHILSLIIIFTGFNPFIILKSYTMKYDALIAIAILYLAILLYDIVKDGEKFISTNNIIALGVSTFFICAFRSAGVYIAIISGICIAIYVLRRFAKRGLLIVLSLVIGLGTYLGSAYAINKAQDLPNYNSLSSYSSMLQQMGYTLHKHGTDALTDAERAELASFMLPTTFEMQYKQNIADNILHNIEGTWTGRELNSDMRKSLRKVWWSLGKRYPLDYIRGLFLNSNRYLLPGYYDDTDLFGSYYHQSFYMDALPKSYQPYRHSEAWQDSLEYFKYIAGYVSIYGVYMGCGYISFAIIIMAVLIKRNNCSLLPILPALFYMIGALFSPVNGWVRYITSVGFAIPLALLYTLYSYQKAKE